MLRLLAQVIEWDTGATDKDRGHRKRGSSGWKDYVFSFKLVQPDMPMLPPHMWLGFVG